MTIPAELDFATERIREVAAWLDSILANSERFFGSRATGPDDPLAVCGLADAIEQSGPAVDPIDALALAIRRLVDAVQPTPRQRALAAIRRMRQR